MLVSTHSSSFLAIVIALMPNGRNAPGEGTSPLYVENERSFRSELRTGARASWVVGPSMATSWFFVVAG